MGTLDQIACPCCEMLSTDMYDNFCRGCGHHLHSVPEKKAWHEGFVAACRGDNKNPYKYENQPKLSDFWVVGWADGIRAAEARKRDWGFERAFGPTRLDRHQQAKEMGDV